MVDTDIIEKPLNQTDPLPTDPQKDLVNNWSFNSTFADHDLDNVFEIVPHSALNADLGGK